MTLEEIFQIISTHGPGIACVGYMIYFQCTTMKEILSTLTAMTERLTTMNERLVAMTERLAEIEVMLNRKNEEDINNG